VPFRDGARSLTAGANAPPSGSGHESPPDATLHQKEWRDWAPELGVRTSLHWGSGPGRGPHNGRAGATPKGGNHVEEI